MPVGDGPDDRYHREAFAKGGFADGTYELIGPKIQGNPENAEHHLLVPHAECSVYEVSTAFDTLREFLSAHDIEGLVWHHPDGRMAKIKLRDLD